MAKRFDPIMPVTRIEGTTVYVVSDVQRQFILTFVGPWSPRKNQWERRVETTYLGLQVEGRLWYRCRDQAYLLAIDQYDMAKREAGQSRHRERWTS
ncbi:MAG TPA: hypothetical protein VEA18_03890 [Candidatus Kapabacteria bacterium]|nr:hypothetical protein [Candidatus Kapabacteria bacterium]